MDGIKLLLSLAEIERCSKNYADGNGFETKMKAIRERLVNTGKDLQQFDIPINSDILDSISRIEQCVPDTRTWITEGMLSVGCHCTGCTMEN